MAEVPNIDERNTQFRALCAFTELRDLTLPTVLRQALITNGITGSPTEVVSDEAIQAVFEALPHADIIEILTTATQKTASEVTLPETTEPSDLAATMSARLLGIGPKPKDTKH